MENNIEDSVEVPHQRGPEMQTPALPPISEKVIEKISGLRIIRPPMRDRRYRQGV